MFGLRVGQGGGGKLAAAAAAGAAASGGSLCGDKPASQFATAYPALLTSGAVGRQALLRRETHFALAGPCRYSRTRCWRSVAVAWIVQCRVLLRQNPSLGSHATRNCMLARSRRAARRSHVGGRSAQCSSSPAAPIAALAPRFTLWTFASQRPAPQQRAVRTAPNLSGALSSREAALDTAAPAGTAAPPAAARQHRQHRTLAPFAGLGVCSCRRPAARWRRIRGAAVMLNRRATARR